MTTDRPKPPPEWLQHLHDARQWRRLIEVAQESLAVEPDDVGAHRHLAWAHAKLGQAEKMAPHVEFLLGRDAAELEHHHLATIQHLDLREPAKAKVHLDRLLQGAPDNPTYHYLACIHALRTNDVSSARSHIQEARRFAPEWAAAAHLEIKIAALEETSAHQAVSRIQRFERALALDPEDTDLLASIGDVYLRELEQPRQAETFYRRALAIAPEDIANQHRLLEAVRARSLLYRTLSMPAACLRGSLAALREKRFSPLILIIAFKGVFLFLLWLFFMGAAFTPAAWIYRKLVLSDAAPTRRSDGRWNPWHPLLRAPLWLRLFLSLALVGTAWVILVSWLFEMPRLEALLIVMLVFLMHFGALLLWIGFRKTRSALGRWQTAGRIKRSLTPPPLPDKSSADA